MGVNGNAFKRLALRLVLRFAGEQVGEQELDGLFADVGEADTGEEEVRDGEGSK